MDTGLNWVRAGIKCDRRVGDLELNHVCDCKDLDSFSGDSK
jgi:hypothetical protein